MSKPSISVVLPCLNGMPHLAEALASARTSLDGLACEILAADGGSTDGTTELLRDSGATVLEGPDGSLYEGLNKAIAAARGDYLVWLNADDRLCPGVREAFEKAARGGLDMVTGEAAVVRGGETVWKSAHAGERMSLGSVLFGVPTINSRVLGAALMQRAGPFRTDVGLAADREMLARLLRHAPRRAASEALAYRYEAHAGSRTMAGDRASYLRVHAANLRMARALEAGDEDGSEVLAAFAARSGLALARAGLLGGSIGAIAEGLGEIAGHPSPRRVLDGLTYHRRYRGRSSGW